MNLADRRPRQVARLQARLVQVRQEIGLPALDAGLDEAGVGLDPLDDETKARLRELGYVE